VATLGYKPKKVKKGHKKPKLTKVQKEELLAYPLSTFTDVIVRPDSHDIVDLQAFITFCLSTAEQAKGPAQSFAPLPAAVAAFDLAQVKAL
jgi:ABC-type phosphate transport system substrate-binding protein